MFIITLIFFIAATIQSAAGFAGALVAMPLLISVIGSQQAAPLFSIIGLMLVARMLVLYWSELNIKAVTRLIIASLPGIPIGVWLLKVADRDIMAAGMGILLVSYSLYALFTPKMPTLKSDLWAYFFGFLGGMMSGAFNTSGPAIVIYGTTERWRPDQFKSNIQGYFLINATVALITRYLAGSYTPEVISLVWWAIPGMLGGMFVGTYLSRRINPLQFRKFVFGLLIVLGIRLIVSAL